MLEYGALRRPLLLAALLLGLSTAAARAQVIPSVSAGPVLVRGLGNHDSAWLVGAGGEVPGDGYALGGEAHYVHFPDFPAFGGVMLSIKGSQYFRRDVNARLRPFATAGFTLLLADRVPLPSVHVGGGVDWKTAPRTALRLEVRQELTGLLSFRCGVVFRPGRAVPGGSRR